MSSFLNEIRQQPEALNTLLQFYTRGEGAALLETLQPRNDILLTGMGASFHAAWIASIHLQHLGIAARSIEATDFLNYSHPSLKPGELAIFISQSGNSAEVPPILEKMGNAGLLAITNKPRSPLAQRARWMFPLLAGSENLIASKTYTNSLALLWLMARRLAGDRFAGVRNENELDLLIDLNGQVERIIRHGETYAGAFVEGLGAVERLVFIGHGPHAATARQAAMIMGEWAKHPVLSFSAGGLRHGFIEALSTGTGAVLFASPGIAFPSILALGEELDSYGVRVMYVSNGIVCRKEEIPVQNRKSDEFLSPILDILPIQFYANYLANELEVPPGFLRIQKVIKKL